MDDRPDPEDIEYFERCRDLLEQKQEAWSRIDYNLKNVTEEIKQTNASILTKRGQIAEATSNIAGFEQEERNYWISQQPNVGDSFNLLGGAVDLLKSRSLDMKHKEPVHRMKNDVLRDLKIKTNRIALLPAGYIPLRHPTEIREDRNVASDRLKTHEAELDRLFLRNASLESDLTAMSLEVSHLMTLILDEEKLCLARTQGPWWTMLKKKKNLNNSIVPTTPFSFFMEEFRRSYPLKHPNKKSSFSDVGKAGRLKWQSLTDAEKDVYVAAAVVEAEEEDVVEVEAEEEDVLNEGTDDEDDFCTIV